LVASPKENTNAQAAPQTLEATAMYSLNMSFFPLVRTLIKEMPISAKRLNEIGIPMRQSGSYAGRVDYAGANGPILLNDGVILDKFDLRVVNSEYEKGTSFSFDIQKGNISSQTVDRELGQFTFYAAPPPNLRDGDVTYRKKVGEYKVFAGYSQAPNFEVGNLTGISFDATIQIKQWDSP